MFRGDIADERSGSGASSTNRPAFRLLKAALASSVGLLALHAAPAWGQQAAAESVAPPADTATDRRDEEETVVVTGSLFRGIESQSNLITFETGEELLRRGASSATDVLQAIAQNQPATVSATSIGAGTGFASYANLRSLGSANTLVLFNGRRVVNNPYQSQGVDLNAIPINLIERVETLSDGASSIYGSDAVAGVINFITRRELTGFHANANVLVPEEQGGGQRYAGSIAAGFGSLDEQGWNIYFGATYRRVETLRQADRDFAETYFLPEFGVNRLNAGTFPANYSQGSLSGNPTRAAGCQPPFSLPNGATLCGSDAGVYADAIPEEADYSALAHGVLDLGSATMTAEYFWSRAEIVSRIAPENLLNLVMCPRRSTVAGSCTNMTAELNPYFPGNGLVPAVAGLNRNAAVTVSTRFVPLGPLTVSPQTDTDRAMLQLDGEIGTRWTYSLWGMRSTSVVRLSFLNGSVVNYNVVRDGFTGANNAPFINPFGDNTAAALAFVNSNTIDGVVQRADSTLWMGGGQIAGELFQLPGGPARVALAVDYRDDEAGFVNAPALTGAIGTGLDTSRDVSGDRQAYSVTGEVNIPIVDMLTIDAALRYDHYSDFGSTVNPKLLVTFRPLSWVELHGSYSTGFRAPTLYNLFAPTTYPISRVRNNDPLLCTGGVVQAGGLAPRDCNIQYPTQNGGNADLDPERSSTYALGVVLRPLPRLRLQVDYWHYRLRDTIALLNESAIFADPGKYSSLIVRCSQVVNPTSLGLTNCNNASGNPIAYVIQTLQNLGDTTTSGVDVNLSWRSGEGELGSFWATYRGTIVTEYRFQREPEGPFFSRLDQYFDGFPVFEYSHYASVGWTRGPYSLQLSNRYLSGYTDCNAQCIGTSAAAQALYRNVGSYSTWDVGLTIRASERMNFTARVVNALDADPPFTNKTQGLGTGYDERYTDPTGRAFYFGVNVNF